MSAVVKQAWQAHALNFLFVAGPGLIVMESDNDAGSVSTYTQAGAQYGTHLLWLLLLLLPVTYFVQEMVVRLGIATGKGHAKMIYERFGKWWGFFSLADLLLVNFLTLITEFAMMSLAFEELGISPYIAVPLSALALIVVVAEASYLTWERIVLVLCALDTAWIASALFAHVQVTSLLPVVPAGSGTRSYIFLVMAIVGTTIAPWQLFFQQSCIADKRLRFSDIPHEQLDTAIGAVYTIIVAGCMMLVGAFLFDRHIPYHDPAQLAGIIGMLSTPLARFVILLMMVNAAILGSTAISLASAWAFGEVAGWPSSLNLNWRKEKKFYAVYACCVLGAAGVVLLPQVPLQLIIVSVQVLAGLMLPSTIIFLQLLLSDTNFLGRFSNRTWNNVINWTIIALLFVLSALLAVQVLLS